MWKDHSDTETPQMLEGAPPLYTLTHHHDRTYCQFTQPILNAGHRRVTRENTSFHELKISSSFWQKKADDCIVAVARSEGTVRCSFKRVQTTQTLLLSRPHRQHPMCNLFLSPIWRGCELVTNRG